MSDEGDRPDEPGGISEQALRDLRPGATDRLRRNLLFGTLGLATAVSLIAGLIGIGKEADPVERFGVPLLVLLFDLLTLLVWKGRLRGPAEVLLLVLGALILLERVHFTHGLSRPGLAPVVETYEVLIWYPSVFVFAFLVMGRRHALLFCLVLVGATTFVLRDWLVPGRGALYHADVTELYTALLGCVVFLYGFAKLKEQFLDTHQIAVHLRSYAETDFLTGVANRRVVAQALEQELRRVERLGGSLGVILLDLDRFKRINDAHGHDEGDRALRRVAYLLDRSRRQTDVFGRWGGEEFLLVAPGLDLEGSRQAAERLRGILEASNRGARAAVTASFGVAEFRPGDGVASLVQRADQALMAAKEQGRNRVETRAA